MARNRNTRASIVKLDPSTFKTPWALIGIRILVLLLLVGCAIAFGIFAYIFAHFAEVNDFNRKFESSSQELSILVTRSLTWNLNIGSELAQIYASTLNHTNEWPNVYYSGFSSVVSNRLLANQIRGMYMCPILKPFQLTGFESFANKSISYLNVSNTFNTDVFTYDSNGVRHNEHAPNLPTNYIIPIWQIDITPGYQQDKFLFDVYSASESKQALDQMIGLRKTVATNLLQLTEDIGNNNNIKQSTILYSPIISRNGSDVIGTIAVVMTWQQIIANNMPTGVSEVDCVLTAGTETITFLVRGGVVTLGQGDLHDTRYDSYKKSYQLSSHNATTGISSIGLSNNASYILSVYPTVLLERHYLTSKPHNFSIATAAMLAVACLIFVLYDYFVSSRGAMLTQLAQGTAGLVDGLFPSFVRDRLMDRHSNGPDAASEASMSENGESPHPQVYFKNSWCCGLCGRRKIYTSLDNGAHTSPTHRRKTSGTTAQSRLEKFVHSTLEPIASSRAPGSARAGSFRQQSSRQASFRESGSQRLTGGFEAETGSVKKSAFSDIIAEQFESVTVLFADVVGFTAWSLDRDGSEVFEFLEYLYADFDRSARLRNVFKVETIGECYVAVTGIPVTNRPHADTMCLFALDMLEGMARVKDKIEGVESLYIRIGLHSGPVIAGVLRGDKTRFQLFGDTVNTASRMMSNGCPGFIQCSQDTQSLVSAPLGEAPKLLLTEREDIIYAKGKGQMCTFFVTKAPDVRRTATPNSTNGMPAASPSNVTLKVASVSPVHNINNKPRAPKRQLDEGVSFRFSHR